MGQKLGSEFLKKFDDYEPPFLFGRTKRQFTMSLGTSGAIGLSGLLYFIRFPMWITFILTGAILVPVFLYGTKKDIEMKERYRFLLTIQKRSYMTEIATKGEQFTKHDFKPHKGITEIDPSREGSKETIETNLET
ncbi:PrgI family protein [Streptococcus ruminantium]|uniref:PrgI family protein n=1 Tax=Streptococcus ruminantium TaxID=1917441 RepID=UPI0012DE6125|nr:PrgI family protein [Streptococcus ruminantium]